MNNRNWNILCWNIRGLNATDKHDAVRNKIEESGCSIICLQETKLQSVDMHIVKKFTPRRYDKFDFVPSLGASGGILVIWNSAHFLGMSLDKQPFGLTISFTSQFNSAMWKLTTIYGPCHDPERSAFVHWMRSHVIDDDENWLFLGDFNFYRSLEDRNKPGGNLSDTLIFNELLGHLGLLELPLK
jgi:exonuclease III